jgi:hypothetical protein
MQTPASIVPEWYLLPFYAILRSIPNKLLGVLSMFIAILILLVLPFTDTSFNKGSSYKPLFTIAFWLFAFNFLVLMWLGSCHVENPFVLAGQLATSYYFFHFLLLLPTFGIFENVTEIVGTWNEKIKFFLYNYYASAEQFEFASNYNNVPFILLVNKNIPDTLEPPSNFCDECCCCGATCSCGCSEW